MIGGPDDRATLAEIDVAALLDAFDLGAGGRLSSSAVARGRLGEIWRLDTSAGAWAVKQVDHANPEDLVAILDGARFQEAAIAWGVPAPAIVRTRSGTLVAEVSGRSVRVQAWADLAPPSPLLDPVAVAQLVAGLHTVPFTGSIGVEAWYTEPVGATRWRAIVTALTAAQAPFAAELDTLVPELLELEGLLGGPPRALRTCHRDLWADNVRQTADGSLCVFDFDNAGLADPSQELAAILVEYAGTDPTRAPTIRDAYAAAGGPGRVESPADFAMPIAQLFHIVEEGCRRWLASTTDADRADNEAWVREFLDRPLTRVLVDALLTR